MRKQFKNKARSCALCKPRKRGWDHRWKPRERQALRDADREIRASPDLSPAAYSLLNASILAAQMKSFSERPPMAWVVNSRRQ